MKTLRDNTVRELQRIIDDLKNEVKTLRTDVNGISVPSVNTGWTKQDLADSGYNDLVVSPASINRLHPSLAPSWGTWLTDLQALSFTQGNIAYFEGMQFPHSYVPGTDIFPHVHFSPTSALSDTETVVWDITYTVASVWSVFPATETVTCTFTNDAESRAKLPADALSGTDILTDAHLIAGGATISGVTGNGIGLSAIMNGKLEYMAASTYPDDVLMQSADSHIRLNRLGSHQEYTG